MPRDNDRIREGRDEDGGHRDDRPPRWADEYDDDDPRDRRGRIRRDEGDATGGLIPYKNPKALAAYYCGVFGLISCFLLLGVFGVVPIVLGFLGLKHAKQYPEARGQV